MDTVLPTVGRMVHYIDEDGEHNAAVVINVNEFLPDPPTDCDLFVMAYDGRIYHQYGIPFEPAGVSSGSWHWPERSA